MSRRGIRREGSVAKQRDRRVLVGTVENAEGSHLDLAQRLSIVERRSRFRIVSEIQSRHRAPSNSSGIEGYYRETIRSTLRWQTSDTTGVRGLEVARVHFLFLFMLKEELFECALVHEYCKSFTDSDPDNGLWIFEPDYSDGGFIIMSVVHLDSIVRAAHLLPVFKDNTPMPREINFSHTLDVFSTFYLNKYIDYHTFETLT
ncbi:hypothetical protein BJ322DRAFT_1024970 [Thelephora terrestris]|uniref:Uncharacterized protein n=1 Tax=Thelephora terrestris TaxID=56493 RepID=A0A9P6L1K1_9AGAM|nr:hypothetical protein BJ322DRAFT_1024970 [Thelephora terrestris]